MNFLSFYPKGKSLFIEFIPDKYIQWQPRTDIEARDKIQELVPIIRELREYSSSHVLVIDCDKALEFDRLNYVLMCKMVSILNDDYPDPKETLKRVEVRHCHPAISAIFNSSKVLLPKKIADIFQLYSK
jgi:hypothetical protein